MTKTQTMLEEIEKKISHVESVKEWNECRDELKAEFPMKAISALDASGYIKTLKLQQP